MTKYNVIVLIFGGIGLFALRAVVLLGIGAIFGESAAERRFSLGLCVWWAGVLLACSILVAGAFCRIARLKKLKKSKPLPLQAH